MKRQPIVIDSDDDAPWDSITQAKPACPPAPTATTPAVQKKKGNPKNSPKGRYWTFTQYDMDWKPPVPYPDGTPAKEVKIRYLICQDEVCPDTNRPHIQGYVQLLAQCRLPQAQAILKFDGTVHMEVAKKDPAACINYCSKLASRLEPGKQAFQWGTPNLTGQKGGRARGFDERDATYSAALKAPTREECIEIIKEGAPRDFFIYFSSIKHTADQLFKQDGTEAFDPTGYTFDAVPEALQQWLTKQFPKKKRARCLIVVGETRLGKTAWSRSITPNHMYFRGSFCLDEWRDGSQLLIADDWNWANWSSDMAKTLFTQNGPAILTDKYCRKVPKNISMPTIILSQYIPPWYHAEKKYWERNAQLVEITAPLYDKARVRAEKRAKLNPPTPSTPPPQLADTSDPGGMDIAPATPDPLFDPSPPILVQGEQAQDVWDSTIFPPPDPEAQDSLAAEIDALAKYSGTILFDNEDEKKSSSDLELFKKRKK